jgi:hypothetical protein
MHAEQNIHNCVDVLKNIVEGSAGHRRGLIGECVSLPRFIRCVGAMLRTGFWKMVMDDCQIIWGDVCAGQIDAQNPHLPPNNTCLQTKARKMRQLEPWFIRGRTSGRSSAHIED